MPLAEPVGVGIELIISSLILIVLGGLAEFERELIRARTGDGRARAVANGVKMGRKPKLTPHQEREAIRRRDRGEESLAEIGRMSPPMEASLKPRESISHEVDHVREFEAGTIALEIEWNNKDPFFDRDLENYKRLHSDGAISMGFIITRGKSLHENMRNLVRRFVDERQIQTFDDVKKRGYEPTSKQRKAIEARINRKKNPLRFREAFVDKFVSDKFGEATTHWRKLEDRVQRGVGNPCPLVLVGMPDTIVTFNEGASALAEVLAEEEEDDDDTAAAE
jgi:hypothetical protein